MSMATEIDRRYERIFAFCNDDLTKKAPTIGLALELLDDDLRSRIGRVANVRSCRSPGRL